MADSSYTWCMTLHMTFSLVRDFHDAKTFWLRINSNASLTIYTLLSFVTLHNARNFTKKPRQSLGVLSIVSNPNKNNILYC